jgi:hypothetical protein
LIDHIEHDFDALRALGRMPRAGDLGAALGELLNDRSWPMYFTGDLDADLVVVHLNPKQSLSDVADLSQFESLEDYVWFHRYFGRVHYGTQSPRTHRSPFDAKQVEFLRPFGALDLVEDSVPDARYLNLERVVDRKLQMELVPYGSPNISTAALRRAPHTDAWKRLFDVVSARTRRYVLFCGAIYGSILRPYVTASHRFPLAKRDGTQTKWQAGFANLAIPHGDRTIHAGLAFTFARQGLRGHLMSEYGRACCSLYDERSSLDEYA